MLKHTPAPWQHYTPNVICGVHTIRTDDGRTQIAELNGSNGIDEIAANAQLIAAAPELLEACKRAKKFLEPDLVEPGRSVFWELVAAINKAEGKNA